MRRFIQAAAAVVLTFSAVACAAEPVVVLPLGDSITAGSEGGYRKSLMKLLTDKYQLTATTVGSRTDAALPAGQQLHEGHPGWRLDQLNDNLMGRSADDADVHGGFWLQGGHDTGRGPIKPTVVTLMAGINDLNQMIGDPKNDPNYRPMDERSDEILKILQTRLKTLVGTLDTNLPDATILLGGCIPYANGLLDVKQTGATETNRRKWAQEDGVTSDQELGVNHWVILFNKWIRDTYVPELQKAGKKVYFVDLYAKFILPDGQVRGWNNQEPENTNGPAAYGDYGLHPNQYGYRLIGEAWAEAIAEHARK